MRRICYVWLLRLHPAPFRRRFAKEMLAIFDEVTVREGARGLFIDAAASLFRQWVLRPEFRNCGADAAVPAGPADIPSFASLDSYRLRPVAVVNGSLLSLVLLCALVIGTVRPGNTLSWVIGAQRPAGALLPATRSSMEAAEPDTRVTFAERQDPWRAVAAVYFKSIPVLKALDADGDLIISPQEIVTAPSVLAKLDRNHDGKLSPEECGFFPGLLPPLDAKFANRAPTDFMRFNPVLATLDSDHNGEISQEEIRNSSRSLRRLDINGDGSLSPSEVMPSQAAAQAGSIFRELDLDDDGRVSAAEWGSEQSASLREILMSADRNHDGFTTMAELTEELLLREHGYGPK